MKNPKGTAPIIKKKVTALCNMPGCKNRRRSNEPGVRRCSRCEGLVKKMGSDPELYSGGGVSYKTNYESEIMR